MKKTAKRKKDSVAEVPYATQPCQPGSAGSRRSRAKTNSRNVDQRTPPTMKLVLGTLRNGDSKRFDVAADLFLAEIVRRVMEKEDRQRDGTTGSTG